MLACPACGAYLNKDVLPDGTLTEWCDYCGYTRDDARYDAETDPFAQGDKPPHQSSYTPSRHTSDQAGKSGLMKGRKCYST